MYHELNIHKNLTGLCKQQMGEVGNQWAMYTASACSCNTKEFKPGILPFWVDFLIKQVVLLTFNSMFCSQMKLRCNMCYLLKVVGNALQFVL